MSKTYMIRWRSKVNGRIGTGSRLFERQEASDFADQLNADYPEIEHEVTEVSSETPPPSSEVKTEGEQPKPRQQALST